MRRRLSGALVVFAALAVWYGWPEKSSSDLSERTLDNARFSPPATLSVPRSRESQQPSATTSTAMSYQQCKTLLTKYARVQSEYWQQWSMDSLTAQGAKSHDIALALYHLRGSSAAASYALMNARQDAELNRINQRLQQRTAGSPAGEQLTPVIRDVPDADLRQAFASDNWRIIAADSALLVDDLAWLMQQQRVSDAVITQLLANVADINATLGSDSDNPPFLHLIDVAARSGRIELASFLLDSGAIVSSQPFLPSTLDASLAYLSMALRLRDRHSDSAILNAIDFIRRLVGMGQQAGFTQRHDGSVVASFHARSSYFYDHRLQQTLAQEYGLFIDNIPSVDVSDSEAATAIRKQISADWRLTAKQVVGRQPDINARRCIKRQQAMWDVWELTFVNVADVATDNISQQLAGWYQQSPILTSCYRNHSDRQIQRSDTPGNAGRQVFRAAIDNNVEQVLQLFNRYPGAAERWFYEVILYQPTLFPSLQAHGHIPDTLTYSMFASGYSPDIVQTFRMLHNQGYDLGQLDHYNRSLLYVAARKMNTELLHFFVEQNVPYYEGEPLPDPLYLWLWGAAMEDHFENTMDAVSLMMREYAPQVSDHHRRLMAAVALKNPSLYQRLISVFPQLDKGAMRVPDVVCAY